MLRYIAHVALAIAMLATASSCELNGKQEVTRTEYIPMSIKTPLPDTMLLDTLRMCAELRLHLRCSVEHSNLWNNLGFVVQSYGDTIFHYAAFAQLYYNGTDGNGIPVTGDTSFVMAHRLPKKQTVDSTFLQKLYIHTISPNNSRIDTVVVVHPKYK